MKLNNLLRCATINKTVNNIIKNKKVYHLSFHRLKLLLPINDVALQLKTA